LKKAALERAGLGQDSDAAHKKPTASELALAAKQAKKVATKAAKARAAAYAEVEARSKRVAALGRAEAHLVTEKLVSSKGRKRKIKPAENGNPAVYLWRRKRLS
jgi:hypothetical protein